MSATRAHTYGVNFWTLILRIKSFSNKSDKKWYWQCTKRGRSKSGVLLTYINDHLLLTRDARMLWEKCISYSSLEEKHFIWYRFVKIQLWLKRINFEIENYWNTLSSYCIRFCLAFLKRNGVYQLNLLSLFKSLISFLLIFVLVKLAMRGWKVRWKLLCTLFFKSSIFLFILIHFSSFIN